MIFIAMDLARNGLPAHTVPKAFVGNAVAAVPVEICMQEGMVFTSTSVLLLFVLILAVESH